MLSRGHIRPATCPNIEQLLLAEKTPQGGAPFCLEAHIACVQKYHSDASVGSGIDKMLIIVLCALQIKIADGSGCGLPPN
jgi:hypothetical protein